MSHSTSRIGMSTSRVPRFFFFVGLFFASMALTNLLTPASDPSQADPASQENTDWAAAHADVRGIEQWESLAPETRTWLIGVMTEKLNRAEAITNEGGRAVVEEILDIAPPVAFILLPLFALLLKLAYIRHDVYYAEHLVLALHNHSFLFIALTVGIPLDGAGESLGLIGELLDSGLELWIVVYLFISLRRVYGQSYPKTLLKYVLLALGYGPLLFFGLLLGFLLGLLTL